MTLIYIMYNPKSKSAVDKRIEKLYKKTSRHYECYKINLLEINNKEKTFLGQCTSNDEIWLCGGDGTLDQFINRIHGVEPNCKIIFHAMGSGNDYIRNFKEKVVDVTELVRTAPRVVVNKTENYVFANGVGMGVDAEVCRSKAQYKFSGIKKNYFSLALSCLRSFRPYDLDVEIDGEEKHYNDVWFFVCNNGKYMGGGMKVAPKASLDDDSLEFVIVHSLTYRKILLLFPLIYFGLHSLIKKHVEIIRCKHVKAVAEGCSIMQRDGEFLDYVKEIEVER